MKPWRQLDACAVPEDGNELQLWQRDTEFSIRLKRGGELMNSRAFASEQALATLICPRLVGRKRLRVLVGGLGLGHTLAAALAALPEDATVVVAELSAGVVKWNRGPLGHLAQHPLNDPRVDVYLGDVRDLLDGHRAKRHTWDAVLLDVDNGPEGLTRRGNDALYSRRGIDEIRLSLRKGGMVGVWSAHESPMFHRRLQRIGFEVEEHPVRARPATGVSKRKRRGAAGKGAHHIVWIGTRK